MKIQTNGDQMEIKIGGLTQVVIGVIFGLLGLVMGILPFLSMTNNNGEKASIWVGVLGGIFFIVGFLLAFTAKSKVVLLVRNGQSGITSKKLIGGAMKVENFQTSRIKAVRLITGDELVETGTGNERRTEVQKRSYLSLVFNDNSTLELDTATSQGGFKLNGINMGNFIRKAPLNDEAGQIAAFLGVSLERTDTSGGVGVRGIFGNNQQNPPQTLPLNPETGQPSATSTENPPPQQENKQTEL